MSSDELLSGDQFWKLFTSFTTNAFRLENRESYYEQNELNAYLLGGPRAVPSDFLSDWFALMRAHRDAGRSVKRVRVVSEPHSNYTRFGLWLSGKNIEAGEDIRYLPRRKANELGLPNMDYWLFDDSEMYIVRFAGDGSLLGAQPVTDEEEIDRGRKWRDLAWEYAIIRADYARANPPKEGLG